jgi:hypothetical protein
MKKKLDIPAVFKSDAEDLLKARESAILIHGTDIRAAGNEVEISVRAYFKRILPPRYYVTHGHLIDINGEVSPQLDIIIADNFNIPSLMTTKDGTEYIPIDSVYAVGEIKSTYYKSEKYIEGFSDVLNDIKNRLFHEEIPNTAIDGIKDDTLLRDIALAKGNRVLNRIFSFMVFVSGGDFAFEDVAPFYNSRPKALLPNVSVLLNLGVIIYGTMNQNGFSFHRYPEDEKGVDADWFFSPFPENETGSMEGNHLGYLYYNLLEHLSNSYLEPPSFKNFIGRMKGRKSLLKKAKIFANVK